MNLRILISDIALVLVMTGTIFTRNLNHTCNPRPADTATGKRKCLKYYHLSTTAQTFEEGYQYCKDHRGYPAYLKEVAQRMNVWYLITLAHGKSRPRWYVGATNDANLSVYHIRWMDGTRAEDFMDPTDEFLDTDVNLVPPYQGCLALNSHTKLLPIDCDERLPIVCEQCLELSGCPLYCECSDSFDCVINSKNCSCTFWDKTGSDFCDLLPCPSFRYGPNCINQCHCRDWAACDLDTGLCPTSGCEGPWMGDKCNIQKTGSCPVGRYPKDLAHPDKCEGECDCAYGQACSIKNGYCHIGCNKFTGGANCLVTDKLCPIGTFTPFRGQSCSGRCNCPKGVQCLDVGGKCLTTRNCSDPLMDENCEPVNNNNKKNNDNKKTGKEDGQSNGDDTDFQGPAGEKNPCMEPACKLCVREVKLCQRCVATYNLDHTGRCQTCSSGCGGSGNCEPLTFKCNEGCVSGFIGDKCNTIIETDDPPEMSPATTIFFPLIAIAVLAMFLLFIMASIIALRNFFRKRVVKETQERSPDLMETDASTVYETTDYTETSVDTAMTNTDARTNTEDQTTLNF